MMGDDLPASDGPSAAPGPGTGIGSAADRVSGPGMAAVPPEGTGPMPQAGPAGPGEVAELDQPDAAGADDDLTTATPPGKPRRRSVLTEMVVLIVIALTIALLIKSFVVQPFFIPSASMENTLQINDKVLVNKLVYDFRSIGRGDIVVFDGTGSWNGPTSASSGSSPLARVYDDTLGKLFTAIGGLFGATSGQTDYIKRVIGLPGDHVRCCTKQGLITVNGVPLQESSYLYPGSSPSTSPFSIVVPPGRLWVLGDHRGDSEDSRLHDCGYPNADCQAWDRDGTIPESAVIGRAFMIIWPPSRIQILRVPSTFGQPALQHSSGGSAGAASNPRPGAGRVGATDAETVAALVDSGGIPVRPSAPYLPLGAGLAAAIPLTLLERRLRLRLRRRGMPRFRGLRRG